MTELKMAGPSGIEAEEPGNSPVLLGTQLLLKKVPLIFIFLFTGLAMDALHWGFLEWERPEE